MTEQFIKNILTEELFGYKVCESVQDAQIVSYIYKELLLEKLLVGEPISVPELRKLLRKKIVNFEFIKLDGEVRPATGTTMMKYIPPKDHPKGIRPSSPKVATFFDLDKDAWRSVSKRSKEIVLKKDKETGKPIIVIKDTPKVKVKAVSKERESVDPIDQGKSYKYTTNRGTNTHIEILRELPNGLFQVSSPVFKTTFAIDSTRIGDDFESKEEPTIDVEEPSETGVKIKDVKAKEQEPETKEPSETGVKIKDVKAKEPVKDVETKEPVKIKDIKAKEKREEPIEKPSETTILLPKEVEVEEPKGETKAPPIDITPPPPPPEEEENPEELEK